MPTLKLRAQGGIEMGGLRQGTPGSSRWRSSDDNPQQREKPDECQWSEQQLGHLVSTIEGEIIPRLMLVSRSAAADSRLGGAAHDASDTGEPFGQISAGHIEEFTQIILNLEEPMAAAYVDSLRKEGVDLEQICTQLLAPAARRLGYLWEEDLCDFTDVTIGLCTLHHLLRELAGNSSEQAGNYLGRALLAPLPGEQHTFGLLMVEEFLRRAGWDVWQGPSASSKELIGVVSSDRFEVVGLSVACETQLDDLARLIRELRTASRNQAVGIMVGGRVFAEKPGLAASVGADATAADGAQAALQARKLISLLKRPS